MAEMVACWLQCNPKVTKCILERFLNTLDDKVIHHVPAVFVAPTRRSRSVFVVRFARVSRNPGARHQ